VKKEPEKKGKNSADLEQAVQRQSRSHRSRVRREAGEESKRGLLPYWPSIGKKGGVRRGDLAKSDRTVGKMEKVTSRSRKERRGDRILKELRVLS